MVKKYVPLLGLTGTFSPSTLFNTCSKCCKGYFSRSLRESSSPIYAPNLKFLISWLVSSAEMNFSEGIHFFELLQNVLAALHRLNETNPLAKNGPLDISPARLCL